MQVLQNKKKGRRLVLMSRNKQNMDSSVDKCVDVEVDKCSDIRRITWRKILSK